jgi:hypothetical protein
MLHLLSAVVYTRRMADPAMRQAAVEVYERKWPERYLPGEMKEPREVFDHSMSYRISHMLLKANRRFRSYHPFI